MPSGESALEVTQKKHGWLDKSKTDEELRTHQLRLLRRRWLKDQELSPREPVLPPAKLGVVDRFWARFLEPGGWWRRQVYKTYRGGHVFFFYVLGPLWIIHYYVKYHLQTTPHGFIYSKPRIYPGDKILETSEIVPPLEMPSSHD